MQLPCSLSLIGYSAVEMPERTASAVAAIGRPASLSSSPCAEIKSRLVRVGDFGLTCDC